MKRWLSLILPVILIFTGCGLSDRSEDTVTFYYQKSTTSYGSSDGVIAAENREITSSNPDLTYLLSLYMKGPVDEALKLPLPNGTRLAEISMEDGCLTLVFSMELSYLEGMDLSIACACICYTCFSLTDAELVRIEAPAADYGTPVSVTCTRESFLLFDDTNTEADAS